MFSSTSPAAPSLSTPTSPTAPASPTRSTSRLRGLSYLRTYHRHSSSHSNRHSLRTHDRRDPQSPSHDTNQEENTHIAETRHENLPGRSSPPVPDRPGIGLTADPEVSQLNTTADLAPSAVRPDPVVTPEGVRHSDTGPATSTMTRSRNETSTRLDRSTSESTAQPASNLRRVDLDAYHASLPVKMPTIRFIPHQDPRAPRPSLAFPVISKTLPTNDTVLRIGRYSEREAKQEMSATTVGFKSKVVSRRHCELWCANSQWFIRDVKSSSGTFLNHIRMSQPGQESRPFPLNDGDVVQLGIDFRGGEEMIFRCVKIRIECNRAWQKQLNNFNKSTHKRLRNLNKTQDPETASTHSSECSICLMSVAPCQPLFVAPCSHVWHYKCIRPILNGALYPTFLCPNCRAVADLEADVEDPAEFEDMDEAIDESMADAEQPSPQATTGESGGQPVPQVRVGQATTHDTNNATSGQQSADVGGEDLNTLMANANLGATESNGAGSITPDDDSDGIDGEGTRIGDITTSAIASPIPISPSRTTPAEPSLDRTRRGDDTSERLVSTPPNNAQYALAANEQTIRDGPMTPTNDDGPFVFDGSGSRRRRTEIESLDEAARNSSIDGAADGIE